MKIRFENTEIEKFINTAKVFGAPNEDAEEILEKFEEASQKAKELQYSWGHVAVTKDYVELEVLPSTMCKTTSALTALAPTIHKIIGIGQMLMPIFTELIEKACEVGDKITDLFKTPCINAIYDYDRNGKRVTVAACRNDVPNGTTLIKAVVIDDSEPISYDELLREISERKPIFADSAYSKENELCGHVYDRALRTVRHYNRDKMEAIIAEKKWQSVKDIAESFME